MKHMDLGHCGEGLKVSLMGQKGVELSTQLQREKLEKKFLKSNARDRSIKTAACQE